MFHRSERLLLRPGWIEDAAELTSRIADEGIVRNLARAPWPYREQDAVTWLSTPQQPNMPTFLLTLPERAGTPIVGSCGIHPGMHGPDPEIGYWVARDWWGRGFATEAARAVLSIAQALGHSRIRSYHAIDNPASGKVLRKAGFAPTGRITKMHSIGRGADIDAPEYVVELSDCMGRTDPPEMSKAA